MLYVISDTHGYDFNKFLSLLDIAGFSDNDFLFILGDVIDRGEDGVKYLTWLLSCYNAQLILGNHEEMLLACVKLFDEITDENIGNLNTDLMNNLAAWQINGGETTINSLRKLKRYDNDMFNEIIDYLSNCPLWDTATAGGKDYLLTHSGIGNFKSDKKISTYERHDFLWNRPNLSDRYFDDITTVFGHTPTEYYGDEYKGKILITDTWIDIDTGAAMGNSPTILRLDDMKTFKINN